MTTISLALSNFLCSKQGKKTAYIELNATDQICSLSPTTGKASFSYMGITIFPCTTLTSFVEILRMDFDYFILDMGVLNVYSAKEFAKCEKQFLVCSLSKWKKKQTLEKIEHLLNNSFIKHNYITLLGNCSSKRESKLSISPEIDFPMITIPFLPNPFHLHSDIFSFFGKILG